MNTQELAERIIQDLQGTKTRNCLVCGSFTAISVAAVKRQLDLALAEAKVPTQNNHPVKVPAVPEPRQSWIEDMAKSCAWSSMPLDDRSTCQGCQNEGIVGCKCPLGEYDGE